MSDYLQRKLDEERAATLAELRSIKAKAEAEERDLSADEMTKVADGSVRLSEISTRSRQLADAAKAEADAEAAMREGLGAPEERKAPAGADDAPKGGALTEVRDIGEFYRQHLGDKVAKLSTSGERGWSLSSPEFRAATDPLLTAGSGGLPVTYGQTIETKYRRLTVADLCAQGNISTNALTYWTQGTLTGDVAPVTEGNTKPSLNFAFGQTTENVRKIAGITKVSQEMTDDAEFMVSIVRSQLVARLGIIEEDGLLNGSGTAPALRGLLNRSGVQTYATPATSTPLKTLNGIFHSQNLVRTGSFIEPDGVVINPTDYENIRLGVDGQSQYYGGGPFTGAYGNDGFSLQPAVWGLPTVVTPAIAAGTVLVGAFKTAAQIFRRTGVQLDVAYNNVDDFEKNLVTLRIEERLALAVFYPTAFVKMTITA